MDSTVVFLLIPIGIFIVIGVLLVRKQKLAIGDVVKMQQSSDAVKLFNGLSSLFSIWFISRAFQDSDFDPKYDIEQNLILFCLFFSVPALLFLWRKFRRSSFAFITFVICWIIGFYFWAKILFLE